MITMPTEPGFYWVELDCFIEQGWTIVEVLEQSGRTYIFSCGWEVPYDPKDVKTWGEKIERKG